MTDTYTATIALDNERGLTMVYTGGRLADVYATPTIASVGSAVCGAIAPFDAIEVGQWSWEAGRQLGSVGRSTLAEALDSYEPNAI